MTSRFYEQNVAGLPSAPAALRNRGPIADVLRDWLPNSGVVLEIASGTGEHAVHFANLFPALDWQPTDVDDSALAAIAERRSRSGLANLRDPLRLDSSKPDWPVDRADALFSANMVHISPWESALGLLDGAERVLCPGAPLILYGPWLSDGIETAASNLEFDSSLKARDQRWGLRRVEDFAAEAQVRGFELEEQRPMPANNLMLLFRKGPNGDRR